MRARSRASGRDLRRLDLRGPRAFPSEAMAATVLAVVWVLLWTVFTAGVVAPAAALRGDPAAAPAADVAGSR